VAQIAKENTMKWHWLCGVVVISALSVLTGIDLGASRAARAGAPTTGAVAAQGTGTPTPRPAPCPPAWTVVSSPNGGSVNNVLYGVALAGPNDGWAVGYADSRRIQTRTEHWDGTAWTVVPSPNVGADSNYLYGVAVAGPSDVWAVGYAFTGQAVLTLIEHWDGTAWTVSPSPNLSSNNVLKAVAVAGPSDVWAVGYYDSGSVHETLTEHWNGSAWTVIASPNPGSISNGLNAVAVAGPGDVWAVGSVGTGSVYQTLTEHWNGTTWSVVPSPNVAGVNNALYAVAVAGARDVWAVGNTGNGSATQTTLTAHWNGTAWSIVPSPNVAGVNNTLSAVAAAAPDDVWAVGYSDNGGATQTLTAHWNGSAWTVVPSSGPSANFNTLQAVAVAGTGAIWAVGYASTGGTSVTLVERYTAACGTPSVTPATSPTPCGSGFRDVQFADYFAPAVAYLAGHGVIAGYSDCTFRPYTNTTRAQMTKIVTLAFNNPPATPPVGGTFADVAPSNIFYRLIETAAAHGLISGYTCGGGNPQTGMPEPCDSNGRPYFRPSNAVTRGQLTKIVVLGAAWPLITPPSPTFTDVAPSTVFYGFIETAVRHGAVGGYSDGTFHPSATAFRGQIAKIVYLALPAP